MSGKKILMVVTPLLFFTFGCASMLTSTAPRTRTYMLNPAPHTHETGKAGAITGNINLLVPTPQTAPGLNTDRIALVKADGRELDYYAGAQWPADLPEMTGALMMESLRGAMAGGTVSQARSYSGRNYRLQVTVEDFQVENGDGAAPQSVHVQFIAYLSREPGGELKATYREDSRVPVDGAGMSGIIKAFEKSYRTVMNALISDIVETLDKSG